MSLGARVLVGGLLLVATRSYGDDTCFDAADKGQSLRDSGKLLAAREAFLACASDACPSLVRGDCSNWLADVDKITPSLVVAARRSTGQDLVDVRVALDGTLVAEHLDGRPLSVDPGPHRVTFEVPGRPPITEDILVVAGEKARRVLASFEEPPSPPAPVPTLPHHGPPPLAPTKVLGLVAGGLGLVGVGVGVAFGLAAIATENEAKATCPANPCATQDGVSAWSNAGTAGNVSTVAFAVGGVLVAAAVVLWLVPVGSRTRLSVGLGSMELWGTW